MIMVIEILDVIDFISTFNYSFFSIISKEVSELLTGNTVVGKPANKNPRYHSLLLEYYKLLKYLTVQ